MSSSDGDSSQAALSDYPVIVTIPVQWGDQDLFGHVNNTVHIGWFESGRVAYIEKSGLRVSLSGGDGIGPILASITCHYRRQVNFPDTVDIGSRISQVGRTSITIDHAIYSHTQNEIAADGQSVIVMFDFGHQRPVRVSEEVRQAIEGLEGRTFDA